MTSTLRIFLISLVLLLTLGGIVDAAEVPTTQTTSETQSGGTVQNYKPLTGIYGITQEGRTGSRGVPQQLQTFITNIFNLTVGIAGILGVIMLMWGGIEYMMSEAVTSKEHAKSRMWDALFGLLFVMFSVVILNTINPDLLNLNLSFKPVPSSFQQEQINQINEGVNTSPSALSQGTGDTSVDAKLYESRTWTTGDATEIDEQQKSCSGEGRTFKVYCSNDSGTGVRQTSIESIHSDPLACFGGGYTTCTN